MAMAYTPGLKVKKCTLVTKHRMLPLPGEVLVQEGEVTTADTIVAETELPGDSFVIRVANMLDTDPEYTNDFMVKQLHDAVKKDDVIALRKGFFGLFKTYVYAPADGTIETISDMTGQVIIRGDPLPVHLRSYISGTVTKVIPKEGVIVETPAAFIQGIFGIGGETVGELLGVCDSPRDVLTAEQIGPECAGKILIGGCLVERAALHKAVEVGAKGIVVGGIENEDLVSLLGYEIGVAITGEERVGLTLIITEGFGEMRMSHRIFNLLKSLEGYEASINGATQIRAGVIRPEIIVPLRDEDVDLGEESDTFKETGMEPGMLIRVIRKPYFGAIGRISSLPIPPQIVETGSAVRVLDLELENGSKVTVPRANVELIEE